MVTRAHHDRVDIVARPRALYEVKKFYDREQDTSFKIKTHSEIQKSKSDVFIYSHYLLTYIGTQLIVWRTRRPAYWVRL